MKQHIVICLSAALAGLLIPYYTLAQLVRNSLPDKSIETRMPDSVPPIKENYLNTVTSTGSDGVRYKLVVVGDLLPKLYVNGQLLSHGEMKKFNEVINKLMPVLWQRQKETEVEQQKEIQKTTSAILNELVDKHYFKDEGSVQYFLLSPKEFIINREKQNNERFTYFRNKYGKSSDAYYYYNKNLN